MSVTALDSWRLAGCGPNCYPRGHSPEDHEAYGRLLEREARAGLVVRTGPLVVDRAAQRVAANGAEVHLSPTERRILLLLASRIGEIVTQDEAIAAVWGAECLRFARPSTANVLRVRINCLRGRLGNAAALVTTVYGVGYRLEAAPADCDPVGWVEAQPCRWASAWDACRDCGTTERPHNARGWCHRCYERWRSRRWSHPDGGR